MATIRHFLKIPLISSENTGTIQLYGSRGYQRSLSEAFSEASEKVIEAIARE